MFLHQILNSKNNGPVLSCETILFTVYPVVYSLTNGKDEHVLKLEKECYNACKNYHKSYYG